MPEVYNDSIFWIETDRIHPNPYQPRREFDEQKLNELAESIRQYGLLQPITVTRKETELENGGLSVGYELISGERRLRAAKIAGLVQIPAIIRTAEDTEQMKLELAIIENLQREDLNAIDRAHAFKRLIDEFQFRHVDVGRRIGKSREYVSNSLRVLALPEEIQQAIGRNEISEGHTRSLLMLNHRPQEQEVLMKEIIMKKLSVREAEGIARRTAQEKVRNRAYINPDLMEIEKNLTEKLGTRVQIEPREVGGRLVISYFSRDDLNHIIEAMQVLQAGVAAQQYMDGSLQGQEHTPNEGQEAAADRDEAPEMPGTPDEGSDAGDEPAQAASVQPHREASPQADVDISAKADERADLQARGALAWEYAPQRDTGEDPAQEQAQSAASHASDERVQATPRGEASEEVEQEEDQTQAQPAVVDEAKADEPDHASHARKERERKEEEDLYSVRNFTV